MTTAHPTPTADTRGKGPATRLETTESPGLRDRVSDGVDHLAAWSETVTAEAQLEADGRLEGTRLDQMMSGMINEIVGGVFAIALGVVLLNQLFDIGLIEQDVDGNYTGAFGSIFGTIESVGGAALIFAVLGMLALAGGTAVRMFRT